MITWLIEYEDGSVFTSDDGQPWEAPRQGVLGVFCWDEALGMVVEEKSQGGYWGWRVNLDGKNGRWQAFNRHWAMHDYLVNYRRSPVIPLYGRLVHDEDFWARSREKVEKYFKRTKGGFAPREKAVKARF